MKIYLVAQINAESGQLLNLFCYDNLKAGVDLIEDGAHQEYRKYAPLYLHELEFDPIAGFQTCNVTQLSTDGTRHVDEYEETVSKCTAVKTDGHGDGDFDE